MTSCAVKFNFRPPFGDTLLFPLRFRRKQSKPIPHCLTEEPRNILEVYRCKKHPRGVSLQETHDLVCAEAENAFCS
jgi:hypothetical protein